MTKLIVDDLRILNLEGDVKYARTPDKAVRMLKENGNWEEAWLDHDLGRSGWMNLTIWPVIKYLEERLRTDPIKIDKVFVITSNPVGAQRMKLALDKMGYATTITNPKPYLAGVIEWEYPH